jgi:hypothetical protein
MVGMKTRRKRLDPNTVVLLKQIGIGAVAIGCVALLITAIWYGTRVSKLTISTVEVSGGETIQLEVVEQLVQATLDGEYLGLVPRRFAWLYPKTEILTAVQQINRIHNIKIERVDGNQLSIGFDEYVPAALWCLSVEQSDCLFLDQSGYAFADAPQLSGGALLRFVTIGREAVVGQSMVEAEGLEVLQRLVALLAEQGWFVSHVELDQVGDAFLKIVSGGELKVAVGVAPEVTVENLLVVLASPEFVHLKPGNFQYIDLRFGNKVFVNEEEPVSPEEEVTGLVEQGGSTF